MKTMASTLQVIFLAFMFVVLTAIPVGCGSYATGNASDVNPDSVFGEYRVELDENKSHVILSSQFRFAGSDGTTLRLEKPALVRVAGGSLGESGVVMQEERVLGTSYSTVIPNSSLPSNFVFLYTRNDGETHAQNMHVHAAPVLKMPATNLIVARGKNLIVEFSLDDASDYQAAVCKIESVVGGSSVYAFTRGTHCVFDAEDLERLSLGGASISVQASWLSRTVSGHGSVGGVLRFEATSKKRNFEIVEGRLR